MPLKIDGDVIFLKLRAKGTKISIPLDRNLMKNESWNRMKGYIERNEIAEFSFLVNEDIALTIFITLKDIVFLSLMLKVRIPMRQIKEQLLQILDDINNIEW
jgi:hypothetical protein